MGTGRPGNPKLDDATWIALLERYVRGEAATALAAEYGVSHAAVRWQARGRGYRKMDRPDAVYRWTWPPPQPPEEDRAARLGFNFDRDDLDGTVERVLALAAQAAARGRSLDFRRLMVVARSLQRLGVAVERTRRRLQKTAAQGRC